jgi:hypothetical protein
MAGVEAVELGDHGGGPGLAHVRFRMASVRPSQASVDGGDGARHRVVPMTTIIADLQWLGMAVCVKR